MTRENTPRSLSKAKALQVIRDIAEDTGRIFIVPHGTKRQRQRGITRRQIELCLQKGSIVEGPFLNEHGNWQVTMHRYAAGEEIECPVAIEWRHRLIVITVYPT